MSRWPKGYKQTPEERAAMLVNRWTPERLAQQSAKFKAAWQVAGESFREAMRQQQALTQAQQAAQVTTARQGAGNEGGQDEHRQS